MVRSRVVTGSRTAVGNVRRSTNQTPTGTPSHVWDSSGPGSGKGSRYAGVGGWGAPEALAGIREDLAQQGLAEIPAEALLWRQMRLAAEGARRDLAGDQTRDALEESPQAWLQAVLPDLFAGPDGRPTGFAFYHQEFWDWLGGLRRGLRPRPFIALWPRAAGKSTSAEAGCVYTGAVRTRTYVWYVSGTQEQADKHVESVAELLERAALAERYPLLADRAVGKYGASKGWRRNRLRCANGFTVDAMGLDSAARGVKVGKDRPDFLIVDDVDDREDDRRATAKKLAALAYRVLPAGSGDCAVVGVQNLVTHTGVFAHLANLTQERTTLLSSRIVSGPHPALHNFSYEVDESGPTPKVRILTGEPTWAHMDGPWCQGWIDTVGLDSFRAEMQHEDRPDSEGIFKDVRFRRCRWEEVPWDQIVSGVCAVDPAVSSTKRSDCQALQVTLLAADRTLYAVYSWERVATPMEALRRAVAAAVAHGCRTLVVETDQGGDLWHDQYAAAVRSLREDGSLAEGQWLPRMVPEKAGALGASKTERWTRMAADYQTDGRIVHVLREPDAGERDAPHVILERALGRIPEREPYDLADAAFYAWYRLRNRPPLASVAHGFVRDSRFLAPQPVEQRRRARSPLPDVARPAIPPPPGWSGALPPSPTPGQGPREIREIPVKPGQTLRVPRRIVL